MSAAAILPIEPPRKRWTRDQLAPLEAAGGFAGEHLELINGELINKMGKNRPHVYVVVLLYDCLRSIFGAGFVNPEAPIDVHAADNAINEPEPDAIVLKRQMGEFAANPQPDDLSLIVEVSDTTLHFDLTTKARLYARAEIQEYWVIDITGRRLIVHRNPTAGVWASVTIFGESEPVTPLAAPTSEFRVAQVLPAAD